MPIPSSVCASDPRQEPGAVVPLAGICAGGGPQGPFLPRTRWCGLRVMDIAAALGKHPATGTGWVMRGVRRRQENSEDAARLEEFDKALSQ